MLFNEDSTKKGGIFNAVKTPHIKMLKHLTDNILHWFVHHKIAKPTKTSIYTKKPEFKVINSLKTNRQIFFESGHAQRNKFHQLNHQSHIYEKNISDKKYLILASVTGSYLNVKKWVKLLLVAA